MSKYPWERHERSRVAEEEIDDLTHVVLREADSIPPGGCDYAMTGDCVVLITRNEDGTLEVYLCAVEREFEIKSRAALEPSR